MICGHVHQAYITNIGDELDKIGQACPVVVGSAPGTKTYLAPRGVKVENVYVGVGFELKNNKLSVDFIGSDGKNHRNNFISV
jgi:hypothetical protein